MERMEMDKLVGKQQNASHEMRPHLQQAAPSLSQSFPKRSSASQPDLLLPISRSTLCPLRQTRTLPTILRSFSLIKVKLDFLDPCQQLQKSPLSHTDSLSCHFYNQLICSFILDQYHPFVNLITSNLLRTAETLCQLNFCHRCSDPCKSVIHYGPSPETKFYKMKSGRTPIPTSNGHISETERDFLDPLVPKFLSN